MANSSNTVPKQLQGKTFTKGDPRINRKGRPKSFDALRALAIAIANETVAQATKKLGIDAKSEYAKLRVADYILRKWAFSGEPALQKSFIEIAYGKVKDTVEHSGTINAIIQDQRESEVETELEEILSASGIERTNQGNAGR